MSLACVSYPVWMWLMLVTSLVFSAPVVKDDNGLKIASTSAGTSPPLINPHLLSSTSESTRTPSYGRTSSSPRKLTTHFTFIAWFLDFITPSVAPYGRSTKASDKTTTVFDGITTPSSAFEPLGSTPDQWSLLSSTGNTSPVEFGTTEPGETTTWNPRSTTDYDDGDVGTPAESSTQSGVAPLSSSFSTEYDDDITTPSPTWSSTRHNVWRSSQGPASSLQTSSVSSTPRLDVKTPNGKSIV